MRLRSWPEGLTYAREAVRLALEAHALNIPIRVVALPAPGIRAHVRQRVLGAPAQQLVRPGGIGIALRHITGAAWGNLVGHGLAAGLLKGAHHFEHAVALAGVTADLLGSTTLTTTLTSASIYIAVAKTNLALGLPAATNLTAAPTAATLAAPNPTETMGELLAAMAAATDPVAQAAALLAAVSTSGTVTNAAAIATVNTILASSSVLNLTIAAPNTNPDTATLNAAVTAVKTVIDAAVVVTPTPTGTGSISSGG